MKKETKQSETTLQVALTDKIFACVNTKGGVGKSVTTLQVLAPYLYSQTGIKPLVVDVDENNYNSNVYNQSKIMDCQCVEVKNFDDAFSDIAAQVISRRPIILDVGAADITRSALSVIDSYSSRIKNRMVWLVPISTGKNDVRNAMETIELIESIGANQSIIVVLSNAPEDHGVSENQINEITFLYFFGNKIMNIESMFELMGKKYPYLIVPGHYIIPATQSFKKTVWEVGKDFQTFDEHVDQEILKLHQTVADNPENEAKVYEESKKMTKMAKHYRVAKTFSEYNLNETFKGLTKILSEF